MLDSIALRTALSPNPSLGKGAAIRSKDAGSQGNFFPTCGMESPLILTLSPLIKGGEGREWGDSVRAGICEL